MRLLRAATHKRMPWKNGGGETVEIAVFPEDAGLGDFDWRISMATVASNGPFSLFEGVDRTLTILSGAGMALAIDGAPAVHLDPSSEPLTFPADVPVAARLVDGPITDLNVMTRRGRFTHRVVRLEGGEVQILSVARRHKVLLACDGGVSVVVDGRQIKLEMQDALLLDDETSLGLLGTGKAILIIVDSA